MNVSRSVVGSVLVFAAVTAVAVGPVRLGAQSSAESSVVQEEGDRVRPQASDSPEARIGFRIAPVRLTFRASDREMVGRGSYLVNAAGGCNDCHTAPPYEPGRDPFRGEPEKINAANYLAGGVAFGPFISRNLTPDANGLPAGYDWPQFQHVMKTGFDLKRLHPQISPLLQVMPWPVYRNLRTQDLRAIYAFLKAIPSASPGAPANPPAQP